MAKTVSRDARARVKAENRLTRAVRALETIEMHTARAEERGAGSTIIADIQEVAADALAELRDPATGKAWEASA